jgi:lysylphosphatidylglycerol synthetase-like protein (DUF2156 family)
MHRDVSSAWAILCIVCVCVCVCCVCAWIFVLPLKRHHAQRREFNLGIFVFCLCVRVCVCCVCEWVFVLPLERHHAQRREFSLGVFVYCLCVHVCAVCARGYLYCHSRGIMHRDVSSAWACVCCVYACAWVLAFLQKGITHTQRHRGLSFVCTEGVT